jgi:hypothetical protein
VTYCPRHFGPCNCDAPKACADCGVAVAGSGGVRGALCRSCASRAASASAKQLPPAAPTGRYVCADCGTETRYDWLSPDRRPLCVACASEPRNYGGEL